MTEGRVLHVRALCVYLQCNAVEIEYSVNDFSLLESDALGYAVNGIAGSISKGKGHVIQGRSLGRPLLRGLHQCLQLDCMLAACLYIKCRCCHFCNCLSVTAYYSIQLQSGSGCIVSLYIDSYRKV